MLIALSALPGAPLAAPNDPPGQQPDASCPADGEDVLSATFPQTTGVTPAPLRGSFEVTPEGAASYQIPLKVVPGRVGMEPSLSIHYSSNSNEEGMVGVGFSLSGFSSIERCPKNLELDGKIEAISFTSDDALCMDGNRLVWTGETGVANGMPFKAFRTLVDGGSRVVGYWAWVGNATSWVQFDVLQPSGLISTYGETPDSRVMAKGGVAASWLESRRRDRRDNAVVFHYQNDLDAADGHTLEVVPSEIAYTDHPTQAAQRKVVFEYGSTGGDARPLVTYRDGLRKHTSKRLERVRMVGPNDALVRSYHLSYDQSPASRRDRLRQVKECAKESQEAWRCRPPIDLEWAAPEPGGPVKKVLTSVLLPPESAFNDELASYDYHMADVNGDGLDDVVSIQMSGESHVVRVALATGGLESSPFAAEEVWATIPKPAGFIGYGRVGRYKVEIGDLDSDGAADLMIDEPFHEGGTYRWLRADPASKTFALSDTGITRTNYPDDVPPQVQSQPDAYQSVRYVDLDGDGVLDALSCRDANWVGWDSYSSEYDAANVTWRLRLGVPGTGTFGAPFTVDLDGTACSADIREVDLDGDGKTELVRRQWETPGLPPSFDPWTLGPYVATELVGYAMFTQEIEGLEYTDGDHFSMSELRFSDVNADGLADAILLTGGEMSTPLDGNDLAVMIVQHNTGRGFAPGVAVVSPVLENAYASSGSQYPSWWLDYWYSRGRFIDVNGDGRSDLLVPWEGNCGPGACYGVIQTNPRFDSVPAGDYLAVTTEVLSIPYLGVSGESQPSVRYRPHFGDVNGDGRTDFLAPDPTVPMVNGHAWLAVYQMTAPRDRVVAIHDGTNPRDPGDPGYVPTVAISYGNLVDLERTWAGINTDNTGNTNDGTLNDPKERYRARSDASNDCAYPRRCVVGTRQVVSGYAVEDGVDGAKTFAVQLRDGRYDVRGRRSLGFGALRIIDTETYAGQASFFDNATYDATLHVYPYAHHVKRSWRWTPPLVTQASQRLTVEYVSRALLHHQMPGRYFTVPYYTRTRVDEADYNLGVSGYPGLMDLVETMESAPGDVQRDSFRLITDFDDFGNVLAEHEETDGVDDVRSTTRVFQNDTSAWILGRERETRVCSTSLGATPCRLTRRSFNTYGELEVVEVGDPAAPATRLDTTYLRDAFGNVTLTRWQDGYSKKRSTCAAYDQEGVFAVATANSLGHVSYARYDRGLGVVTARRDPNGLETQLSVDETGQTRLTFNMDGTWRHFGSIRQKVATPGGDVFRTVSTVLRSDGASEWTTTDSHGRTIETAKPAPIGPACGSKGCVQDGTIVTEVVYDHRGLVASRSNPHLLGEPPGSVYGHVYQYDGLGRVVQQDTPWGATVSTEYDGRKVRRTTPLGTTTVELDPLGREKTVVDARGGATTFTYGPFGNVWYVDAVGSVTAQVYDDYGRRITHVDPDRGTTFFEYDGYGQRLREQDALGRVQELTYDALGRKRFRLDPDGLTTWEYDGAAHGKGKPHKITSPTNVREIFSYDAYGRANATSVEIGAEKLTTSFEYDSAGRLASINYPEDELGDNQVVKHHYDARGYLAAVSALLPIPEIPGAYHAKTIWEAKEVDGAGHVQRYALGNGLETLEERSPADGTLRKIQTTDKGGSSIQSLRYDYDLSMLLTARLDDLQGDWVSGAKSERFEYDELGRLECAYFSDELNLGPHTCATSIEYEPNGNIRAKSDVGLYQYHPGHPHAVQAAGNLGFEYDAVGNQIGRPGVFIAYTAFDLPSRYTLAAGGEVDFFYTGGQERVRKLSATEERTTIGKYYDRRVDLATGDVEHRYRIWSPQREVAAVVRTAGESAVEYQHADHLGSLDVETDQKGDVVRRLSFDAFGEKRNPAWGQPGGALDPIHALGFTGMEHDEEAGIVNMRGRLYDPHTGRFLNVDPKVPNPRSTQSWNPYTYALNSPLSLVDPDGLEEKEPPKEAAVVAVVPIDSNVDEDSRHFLVTLDDGSTMVVTPAEIDQAVRANEQQTGPTLLQDEPRASEPSVKSTPEPTQRSSHAGSDAGSAAAPAGQAGKAPPAPAPYMQAKHMSAAHREPQAAPKEPACSDCAVITGGVNLGLALGVGGTVEGGGYVVPGSGEAGGYGSAGSQIGLAAGFGPGVSLGITFDRKDLDGESKTLSVWFMTFSFSTKVVQEFCGHTAQGDCYRYAGERFDRLTGISIGKSRANSGVGNLISVGQSFTGVQPVFDGSAQPPPEKAYQPKLDE